MNSKLHLLIAMVLLASSLNALSHGNGAPAGYTGSPGDAKNCTYCHGGTSSNITGFLSTNIPSAGYKADSTYDITVNITGSGNKGFEVSPQKLAGTQVGTMIAGSGSHTTGGTKYVTHTTKKSSNPATWVVQWKAPSAGSGDVTFYMACVVTATVIKLENITVPENVALPLSVTASATPSAICSGSSSQLNCSPGGGSGSYTYSWTSTPAGFTSILQNPVVQPTENTVYYVSVDDGINSVSASASVDVQQSATVNAGADTLVCDWADFISLSSSATNYASVLWTTSGDGSFSHPNQLSTVYNIGSGDKVTGSANLTITATAISPCSGSVSQVKHVLLDPCTGIETRSSDGLQLTISPNPAHGSANLFVSGLKAQKISYAIINSTGKLLISAESSTQSGEFSGHLDITSYAQGIYFIRVVAGTETINSKLIVQ